MPLPRRRLLAAAIAAPALLLAGCGFRLRGQGVTLPYRKFHIELPEHSEVRVWLERYIRATGGTEIVDDPQEADGIFQQLADQRHQIALSVNAQGRVRENRLMLTYRFRVVNTKAQELVPANEIVLSRDVTYDDSSVLAKDLEAGLLWRDMNNDLVNQIMRRLTLRKPRNPDEEDAD